MTVTLAVDYGVVAIAAKLMGSGFIELGGKRTAIRDMPGGGARWTTSRAEASTVNGQITQQALFWASDERRAIAPGARRPSG